ncbi:hypothetical protein CFRA_08135 [Corynebacterium frankenforstense DSM 45800]|uniref:SAV-6107-like HEPN domain-containing protein n=1 Tax=Corynebacterium frankenforstense DSM 45800 TaxID=1437875 RepID=A0A1L7CTS3_9CORY|nr:SAV_6107 family HEPN domain-containing protein [Corynebacterium frankenforstense]APT89230.1 hypothetical protein CFRA_08135 [Corynebacterium frankenforstense DSM 45800]
MPQLISATAYRSNRPSRSALFLAKASRLMAQAARERAAGRLREALEYAYQAGLRAAGARVADSPVAGRRRLPTGAWDRLSLVGPGEKVWAKRLSGYSTLRSRVLSGLESGVDKVVVDELIAAVADFIAEIEYGEGDLAAA